MPEKGIYLYCIIKNNNPPEESKKFNILGQAPLEINGVKRKHRENRPLTGQEGKEIYTINQKDLAVVVSDSEVKDYFLTREDLLTHQRVVEGVMREGYDVLPVGFGVVAENEEDIKEKILKSKREELLRAFKTVEGKVELGLKVLWKEMPNIFQEIVAENKDIQIAKKQAQKNPTRMKLAAVGELVKKALERKREREAEKIFSSLEKLAVDFKERPLMGDSMILNIAFLIPRLKEKAFDRRVEALTKEYNRRMKFIYIGPLPPFNFIEIHLKVQK